MLVWSFGSVEREQRGRIVFKNKERSQNKAGIWVGTTEYGCWRPNTRLFKMFFLIKILMYRKKSEKLQEEEKTNTELRSRKGTYKTKCSN